MSITNGIQINTNDTRLPHLKYIEGGGQVGLNSIQISSFLEHSLIEQIFERFYGNND